MRRTRPSTPKRPGKNARIITLARELWAAGSYLFSAHVLQRMQERHVTQQDVADVLLDGSREPSKDEFDVARASWRYAFRNRNVDGRDVRVVIALHEGTLLIIVTVIDKGLKED